MSTSNENRPGYIKTKVGWIPEEWDITPLKRICSMIKDGTHFSPNSKSGPYRYITSKNILFGRMDLNNCEYISKKDHAEIYKRCPVQYGDVLLTKDGANTGNATLNILKEPFSLLSSVAVLREKFNVSTNEFILYSLLSPFGQYRIKDLMAGQAITRITLNTINNFEIILPPLPEQKKIAEILSTWDRAIEQTQKLINTKQRLKKGLMQQLLTGRMRFPEFGKPVRKKGELPEGWKEVRLGDISNCIRGVSYKSNIDLFKEENKNTIRLLRSNNISNNKLVYDDIQFISKSVCSENQILKNNDIVMCMANGVKDLVGKCSQFIGWDEKNYAVGAFCSILRIRVRYHGWIKHLLLTDIFKKWIYERITGTNIYNLYSSDVISLIVRYSDNHEEYRDITSLLNNIEKEIELLQEKKIYLQQQQKGLMQKLLTGEVRVRVN